MPLLDWRRLVARPAGLMLHPVAIAATGLLWLNDHYGKRLYPGWITGKLSDVCGLIFFPLFVIALFELLLALVGRARAFGERAVAWAAVGTGIAFASIKVSETAADIYRYLFGLRWMLERLWTHGDARIPPVRHVVDPTDLLALPALLVPIVLARRARGAARAATPPSTLRSSMPAPSRRSHGALRSRHG